MRGMVAVCGGGRWVSDGMPLAGLQLELLVMQSVQVEGRWKRMPPLVCIL